MSDELRRFRLPAPFGPGARDAEWHARAREGFERWLATVPRCTATRRDGKPCQGFPAKGAQRCAFHGGPKLPSPARDHAQALRAAWRLSPWVPGFTVALPTAQDEMRLADMLAAAGLPLEWLSPRTRDWVRWRFVGWMRAGQDGAQWDGVLARLRVLDAKDGPEPPARVLAQLPDYTSASQAHCWHPRLTINTPWRPSKGRSRTASPQAREQAAQQRLAKYQAALTAWRPSIGPARLTDWERGTLERAQGIDARQGTSHMEAAAKRAIEGGRAARERESDAQREADLTRLRQEVQASRLVQGREQVARTYVVDEDGQLERADRAAGGRVRGGRVDRGARAEGW